MTMSKSTIVLLTLVTVGAMFSLVSGAFYLEVPLPGGLPIGNALVAIGLCSAAGAAIGLSQPGTLLRRVSTASFVAALAWLPVSVALAGNLALNFSGPQGILWIGLSLSTVVAVLGSLVWALIRCLLEGAVREGSPP
ncbi:MAG: hypothetical protein WD448_00010 [Woeseia sp.]